jgi:transposase
LAPMADTGQWKKRVEDWRASGLSAGEYCREREFTAATLYRWSSRLALAARSETVHALPLVRLVRAPKVSSPASVEVAPQGAAVIIEVHGTRVLVPPGADVATVGVVLQALGAGGRSLAR